MKQYTVKEVSQALGVNPRAVQKRCVRANLDMTKGVYLIPENVFKKWIAKKERTSNMTIVRPSTLEKENYVRSQEIGRPDYASISKRPQIDEAEALKKFEEEKKADEAKLNEELKKDPKAKAKPPPAKKGGKADDKPQLDVPKLDVP